MARGKWSTANAATSVHGLMVCCLCNKPITSGIYLVRESKDAFITKHLACAAKKVKNGSGPKHPLVPGTPAGNRPRL